MKTFIIINIILLKSFVSLGQIDSNKVFESTKGQWSVPITKYKEIYNNEVLKHCTMNSFDSTLRIITDSSYSVSALHDGRIVSIIEGEKYYIILTKYGDYFISYWGLSIPRFLKGDFITAGQILGELVKDEVEDNYMLKIELSKRSNELSAEKWIKW